MPTFEIAGRTIGPDQPCFLIAEAGVNHNGRLDLACALVDAAADAGADAIKFQTFRTEDLVTPEAPKAPYQAAATGAEESQYEMLKRLELGEAEHRHLIAYSASKGLLFLSTPFDEASAALLTSLELPALKIPSGELTNLDFLALLARQGRPLILSTGMATLAEVGAAVAAIRAGGPAPLALLHCVSNYPADPASANLRAMSTLAATFAAPVGFSDHTLGLEVAFAAVALGACILEKHLTLDRTMHGPDHAASLEPAAFKALATGVRKIESALGHGRKEPAPSEADTAAVARKSLVTARPLQAGEMLTADAVAVKRPGTGLAPGLRQSLLGRRMRTAAPAGTLLSLEMLE